MTQTYRTKTGRVLAGTYWFTALLNGVFAASGEEALPQPPSSPTHPTTPNSPLLPGNPGDDGFGKWSSNPLQYGAWDVHLNLFGGAMYDDNIGTTEKNPVDDFIFSVSPRVTLATGDYREREANLLLFDYTPSFIFYADNSDQNTINHAASGAGQLRTGPWLFNLSQGYLRLADNDIDAGEIVARNIFTTLASAQYELSPKTSLQLNGRQSINNYEEIASLQANSYSEWTVEAFADYLASPKLKVGLGVSAGWLDNRASLNSQYQQILTRVSYEVTEKVDLQGRVGLQLQEFEEYQGETEDNRLNGIFSFGVGYRPVEKTAVALSAYRQDRSSVSLLNEAYTVTGFDASVHQALTDRVTVGISGGYSFTDYYATSTSATSDRQDNYWRVQLSLDWRVMEQLSLGVFYQYRTDDSSGSTSSSFSFENNQVGLNLSYRF